MSTKKRAPADDAGLPELRIAISPYVGHSVVTVVISTRNGGERSDHRLARWHIPLTRADLTGRSTNDVLESVLAVVLRRVKQQRPDPADWHASRRVDPTAVGPGAPASGATGAVQDPLPGLPADSGTPGGVDHP